MGKGKSSLIAIVRPNLEIKRLATQEKLYKLVSAYIDGDMPKENYLKKKEELLKQKVSLASQKRKFWTNGKELD